jgi:pimeloyl-ACP methyl ester carboxylesterase
MAAFLLLHGAWHGAWCWDPVVARVARAGHDVIAPDLPGLNLETAHAAGHIGLGDHIAAAVDGLDSVSGCDVIVVAHSYAGMLARAIEGLRPHRLAHICYLEALMPEPGQAALDLVPASARASFLVELRERPDGPVLLPPDVSRFAIPGAALAETIASRLLPQPYRTFTDPLPLPAAAPRPLARTYVFASDRDPNPYQSFIDDLRTDAMCRVVGMEGGHELMLTRPDEIAGLLLDIAATRTREQATITNV